MWREGPGVTLGTNHWLKPIRKQQMHEEVQSSGKVNGYNVILLTVSIIRWSQCRRGLLQPSWSSDRHPAYPWRLMVTISKWTERTNEYQLHHGLIELYSHWTRTPVVHLLLAEKEKEWKKRSPLNHVTLCRPSEQVIPTPTRGLACNSKVIWGSSPQYLLSTLCSGLASPPPSNISTLRDSDVQESWAPAMRTRLALIPQHCAR